MTCRWTPALEMADRLARHHVRTQGAAGPDKAAWWRLWNEFTERKGHEWSEVESACILAYAIAALRYDGKHRGSAGLWSGKTYDLLDTTGPS